MMLEISRRAVDAILFEAGRDPAREACGLLLGRGMRVTHVLPCRNVAADPRVAFEIDPHALIDVHRRARAGKPGMIGCYHSHPNGDLLPSRSDGEAAQFMATWLIVADGTFVIWQKTAHGQFAGGFEPINCELIGDGCTKVGPSPEGANPYSTYESHNR